MWEELMQKKYQLVLKPIADYISKIPQNPQSLYFAPITTLEIEKIISKLEPKKSSGHDGISNKLIKDLCDCTGLNPF